MPRSQIKQCARCRLTVYCSKECQAKSWQAGHKNTCQPNLLFNTPDGTPVPKPAKYSEEWTEQQVDKALSAWLQQWRPFFCRSAVIALDLPNHPPERVMTHCMTLWVQSNFGHDDRLRDYWVKRAEVKSITELLDEVPDLKVLFPEDPSDPNKVRYVVILMNFHNELRRARCIQFNHRDLERMRNLPKDAFSKSGVTWSEALIYAVDKMQPDADIRRRTHSTDT
ncbi:hypothetical protein BOTBODRAFT_33766 [Botryobasidium botryosum FD-172 SS1]|uniref:MYND-type domain-containing protein n=1 Tax=Botryobasidium botryosum (strain FD-172 SS1) TaxID=930990 RepID=A0A067MBL1_BOTB1|nr:hypothetical protein BOTBODRAFT_33766 [Botryobasidium botryosum FD-172 SS1]